MRRIEEISEEEQLEIYREILHPTFFGNLTREQVFKKHDIDDDTWGRIYNFIESARITEFYKNNGNREY